MPKLTTEEVEDFLSEPGHLARIGTVDDDGMPRVVPLWFIIDDSQLLFTPRTPALIWKNLQRDPRVGISIDEEAHPWRKLTVQGSTTVVYEPGNDDEWRDLYRAIARRYVPRVLLMTTSMAPMTNPERCVQLIFLRHQQR